MRTRHSPQTMATDSSMQIMVQNRDFATKLLLLEIHQLLKIRECFCKSHIPVDRVMQRIRVITDVPVHDLRTTSFSSEGAFELIKTSAVEARIATMIQGVAELVKAKIHDRHDMFMCLVRCVDQHRESEDKLCGACKDPGSPYNSLLVSFGLQLPPNYLLVS
jgi:hypothetical protein